MLDRRELGIAEVRRPRVTAAGFLIEVAHKFLSLAGDGELG